MKPSLEIISHSRPTLAEEDVSLVSRVIRSGMLAGGEITCQFEAAIADYVGAKSAVTLASGTAALAAALRLVGVQAGAEVIVPTYCCRDILTAIYSIGAQPILCDVAANSWSISVQDVQARRTIATAAIVAVHTYGLPADVLSLAKIGVPVIEDCSHAFGATSQGKMVGLLGDAGVYSFNATKCLTTGEGGAVVTDREVLSERLRRDRGSITRVAPLSDMQAALGLGQLAKYESFLDRRHAIAAFYLSRFPSEWTTQLRDCTARSGGRPAWFRFLLDLDYDFDQVKAQLEEMGVHVRRGVDRLLHHEGALDMGNYSHAEERFSRTLSIPIYPSLTFAEQERVVDCLLHVLSPTRV